MSCIQSLKRSKQKPEESLEGGWCASEALPSDFFSLVFLAFLQLLSVHLVCILSLSLTHTYKRVLKISRAYTHTHAHTHVLRHRERVRSKDVYVLFTATIFLKSERSPEGALDVFFSTCTQIAYAPVWVE